MLIIGVTGVVVVFFLLVGIAITLVNFALEEQTIRFAYEHDRREVSIIDLASQRSGACVDGPEYSPVYEMC